MDKRGLLRAECAAWVEEVLYPLALQAAQVDPAPPDQILLSRRPEVRRLRERDGLFWNEWEAMETCEDLLIVAAAVVAAEWAGDNSRAQDARDAILLLAYDVALELSVARELNQDAADALHPAFDPEFAERAQVAEAAFTRWPSLDAPIGEALVSLVRKLGLELL